MLPDHRNEIRGSVNERGRLTEVWIVGNEIVRTRVDVSEITSTPAGDSDFLAYTFSELDNKDSPASFFQLQSHKVSRRLRHR